MRSRQTSLGVKSCTLSSYVTVVYDEKVRWGDLLVTCKYDMSNSVTFGMLVKC